MKVQFLGKGNKILYCDDEIIRITKEKTLFKKEEVKEKKIHDFGKVEINNGSCIKLYDHYGELWDEVCFNKKYLDRTEKVAQKLRNESRKYIESFKDEKFYNNEKLIPTINDLLQGIKKESEFIDTIYTLEPEVFRTFSHPVNVFFKKNEMWEHISFDKMSKFAESLYDIVYNVFKMAGYVFEDGEDIQIHCHRYDGYELITYSSQTKQIIKEMIEEGKM